MLDQYILEYGGFSAARGRCHVVLDRATLSVLVGDPRDNPGTSVTKATEQVAFDIHRVLSVDVMASRLYAYVPWDGRLRREYTAEVKFRGDAWSMPVWTEIEGYDEFLTSALALVHEYHPYALRSMTGIPVVNEVFRVRIDAPPGGDFFDQVAQLGSIAHISQRRFYYVDVPAESEGAAVARARQALAPQVPPDHVQLTTPNAPLDQPHSLPV